MVPDLDPLYWHTGRWLIAGVFALALIHKLTSLAAFENAVREYRILPAAAVPFAARLFVALETVVVSGLVTGLWLPAAAVLAGALLGSYGTAIAVNLARGRRDIDCGCFGPAGSTGGGRSLSGWLLLRNLLLIMIIVLLLAPVAPRELDWFDLATIAAAAAAGLAIYLAADELIANAPSLSRQLQ